MPRHLNYPRVPVQAILKGSAERFGTKTAYIYHEAEYSFQDIYESALRFADSLSARGIGFGDVVAIHMLNCPQYVIAYYGILMTGATFTPVNPLIPVKDLEYQLNDSSAKAILTQDLFAASIQEVLPRTRLELVMMTSESECRPDGDLVDAQGYHPDWVSFKSLIDAGHPVERRDISRLDPVRTVAHLAYTGGTTGRSKGVIITHQNVISNVLQFACWQTGCLPRVVNGGLQLEPLPESQTGGRREYPVGIGEAAAINLTPWFHAMGTIGYLNNPVLAGTTSILHVRFDPGRYLEDAEHYRVTSIGGAPPVFVALMRHPDFHRRNLDSVRGLGSGAAPLPVEVIRQLEARFPNAIITEAYGLTEVTMGAVSNPGFRSGTRKPGTVGVPVFDTEVKIVAADGSSDVPLPSGEEGEVCIRGPQVMMGYLNQPEVTNSVLRDGWLYTGDIGVLDEDGYLSIVDRKKDLLIYKGYNVYPRELEEILFRHPAVANVAVVGRPVLEVGEIPKAFVVKKADAEVTEEELMDFVNTQVAPYKKVRMVEFLDEIPVSAAGKVLKRVLRERQQNDR
ncbi:acyl-CoA synthetase [Alicyclobacillus ferrooxydans]|uniref:Acyl-CoA synthetase n=2 Tax=Alicyclobacillus ferrooxydans TaxID=471514 RepID=A0A0P9CG87_9BACL|nr:acyl-CoA synthetase [Alicyclobacillus ferrooxydans]